MQSATTVYISIGSNVEPERHVRLGLQALTEQFGPLQCSPIYPTKAVGFDGDDFLNAVIGFQTKVPVDDLRMQLKHIEQHSGRKRGAKKFSARTLDLDILLYGNLIDTEQNIPRDEITRYAFVLGPLADIAGDATHPELQQTYAELWAASGWQLQSPLNGFKYIDL